MKKMKYRNYLPTVLFVFSVVLCSFLSCTQSFQNDENNSVDSNTYLVIKENNVSLSRSINPDLNAALDKMQSIYLYATKTGESQVVLASNLPNLESLYNQQFLLEQGAGVYSFQLKGIIDSVYFNSSVSNVAIEESKTNPISLELSPAKSATELTTPFDDFGGVDFKLNFDTSKTTVSKVQITVEQLVDGSDPVQVDERVISSFASGSPKSVQYKRSVSSTSSGSTSSGVFSGGRIETGTYKITFRFYYDTQVLNTLPYVVNVSKGLNTVFEDTVDLNEVYKNTYNYNNGSVSCSLAEGQMKIDNYTRKSSNIILPRLKKANHIFCGWYDENENLVTSIPANSTGNKTLTAHWIAMDKTQPVTLYVNRSADYHYGNSEEYGYSNLAEAIETILYTGGGSADFVIKVKGRLLERQVLDETKYLKSYAKSLLIEGASELFEGEPQDGFDGCGDSDPVSENGGCFYLDTKVPVTFKNILFTNGSTSGNGGGLYLTSNANVTLDGVLLDNSFTAATGEGIYSEGILKLKGNVLIQSNIYLAADKTIVVAGDLSNSASTIATVIPASYTEGVTILEAQSGSGVVIEDIVPKISIVPESNGGTVTNWNLDSDGKLFPSN